MKTQVERNDACEAVVTVEIDPGMVDAAKQKAARQLSEKANLPGFRKGKAPYAVVLNAFGEEALLEEALDSLGPDVYRQMLDSEKLEPSAVGRMESLVSKDPLTLKFVVPLKPEIVLGDYRAVRIPFEAPSIPDEDVERAMEELRLSQSLLEPVTRPAQKGDVLSANVTTFVLQESGTKEALSFEGDSNPMDLDLDENLGGRYPGAGTALEGISEGETRQTEIEYPDSFPVARLRGLKVALTIQCLGVKVRHTPDWSDELAKTIAEKDTVDALRKDVRERMEHQAREEKEQAYADTVLDKMVEGATVKYPAALLEEELEEEVAEFGRNLEERKSSLEIYLRTIPDGLAGLTERIKPAVQRRLTRNLFLAEFIKQELLEPSDADVDKEFEEYLQRSETAPGRKPKRSKDNDALVRRLITNNLLSLRVTEHLAGIGQGKAPEKAA